LKPGHYRFRVQACNADEVWNLAGDTLEIQLPPRFYQTAWFKWVGGLLGLGLLAGMYGWRVRHLHRKQRKLQKANELLECRVRERTHELLEVSHRAGMAEVATDVLHSVGNALNSVNVSASLLRERIGKSDIAKLQKATDLLRQHEEDLPGFLAKGETGKQFITYLESFAQHFREQKAASLREVRDLESHVERIKEIVAMQQAHAGAVGVVEVLKMSELVDDALRVITPECERLGIHLVRNFADAQAFDCDRHRLFQILLNLLKNAVKACEANGSGSREISVRIGMTSTGRIETEVADNGIGIPSENLTRIFSEGFTTRKNGHGYSLHRAALAAKELGGSLTAASDGLGKGARFVLELPLGRPSSPGSNG
jgi:signal transduction histidine kinase